MEVTTVSPSPASHTEGDDLCEIDVSNVAIHSVALLISLCGLAGNGAVLCLLSLRIRNTRILEVAFADFLFLLFTVPSALLFLVEDVSCSSIMPQLYLNFLFQLSLVSYYWVLIRLTCISSVVKMFELCCRCHLPHRLVWVVITVKYWAFYALFIVIPAVTNLCPSQQQQQCRAALITMYAVILLLFPASTVISSTIKFIKSRRGSTDQQPEKRDIIAFFILLFVLILSLCNFLQQLGYIVLSSQVFFLLNCIQSTIKPFIYFLVGRCWSPCALSSLRLALRRIFDEQKEKPDHSNNAPMDTESTALVVSLSRD